MRFITISVACVALFGCADPTPTNGIETKSTAVKGGTEGLAATDGPLLNSHKSSSTETPVENAGFKTTVTITEGYPEKTVDLIPVGDAAKRASFAAAMRESGFACSTVSNVYQLKEEGRFLDIMKVDCDIGSFQITSMNGKPYIKPWTGNLLGR